MDKWTLDRLLAERLMGWTQRPDPYARKEPGRPCWYTPEGKRYGVSGPWESFEKDSQDGYMSFLSVFQPWSCTGNGMMEVVEAMHKKGWGVQIEGPSGSVPARATFFDLNGTLEYCKTGGEWDGESIPEAVGRAALGVLGVEVPHGAC